MPHMPFCHVSMLTWTATFFLDLRLPDSDVQLSQPQLTASTHWLSALGHAGTEFASRKTRLQWPFHVV